MWVVVLRMSQRGPFILLRPSVRFVISLSSSSSRHDRPRTNTAALPVSSLFDELLLLLLSEFRRICPRLKLEMIYVESLFLHDLKLGPPRSSLRFPESFNAISADVNKQPQHRNYVNTTTPTCRCLIFPATKSRYNSMATIFPHRA